VELLRSLIVGGLAKGGAYALVAVGYTMVYGAISVIHFAHGEIFMIGAFSALIFASVLGSLGLAGWGLLAAAAAAGCVWAAAYGYFTEKAACQPLRGAGPLAALISAIGMSLFLQNFVFLAQTPSTIPFPELIPEIKLLSPYKHIITSAQAAAIITSALALSALLLFLRKTRAGAAMRAAAQDPDTARLPEF
jgi:branched-chain amino acid transport system permease protein